MNYSFFQMRNYFESQIYCVLIKKTKRVTLVFILNENRVIVITVFFSIYYFVQF